METRRKPGRCAAWVLIAVLAAAGATAAPATAMQSGTALSPVLAELAKPEVRALPPDQQAEAVGVAASGPGSLVREGGRVVVTTRFDHGAIARLGELKEAGARVLGASRRYQTATTAVAPAELESLDSVPGLVAVTPSRAPIVYGTGTTLAAGEGPCEGGSVISEGLGQLKVDAAREAFGQYGKGITVGVLSDSFDKATAAAGGGPIATHAHEDVLSNDLPGLAGTCSDQQTPVDVLEEGPSGSADEGRAMLQIIHDLAPKARLAFATAFSTEEAFARNVERLAESVSAGGAGADVIVDDVGYFAEPFFQDGPVATAVNKVTAEGVTYLSAAGNDNLFEGENPESNEIASWEAPAFRDAEACPPAIVALSEEFEEEEAGAHLPPVGLHPSHCMDFDPEPAVDTTFGLTVSKGATLRLDLQWAEPWEAVGTDLDAFLLNAGGEVLTTSLEDNINVSQQPFEYLQWKNNTGSSREVQLVVNRFAGALPRLKFALLENGHGVTASEYPESSGGDVVGPTIYGHAASPSAIAVGAINYAASAAPEKYSSRGPVTHYFGPVEGAGPAEAISPPEEIAKPDVTATDCGATTFFASYSSSAWRFCGTSAAAPHAAAVAALLRQADPSATSEQIRESLLDSADLIGSFPQNAVGSGLVNALAAFESLPETVPPEEASSVGPPSEPEAEEEPESGINYETEPEVEEEPAPVAPSPPSSGGGATGGGSGSAGPSGGSTGTAGQTSGATTQAGVAPATRIARHPRRLVRTRWRAARVVFRFASDQEGVTFLCSFDGRLYRACGARVARRFGLGRHLVRVRARSAGGRVDPTPSVFGFRVKRVPLRQTHSAHRHPRSAAR